NDSFRAAWTGRSGLTVTLALPSHTELRQSGRLVHAIVVRAQGPVTISWCWAQGALYYRTFDGKTFQFRGNCSYVMVESDGRGSPTPPFLLETSTDRLGDSRAYSFSRSFTLRLYGHKLSASRYEPGLVRVDGQLFGLPVSLHNEKLKVTQQGRSLLLVTNFALRLIFDWDAWLGVRLPGNIYRGRVSGLCGNLDGNSSNDQVTPAGVPAPKTEDFAGSWRVPGLPSEDQCYENCSCPECPQAQEREYRARELCGALNHPSGPFAACHGLVSPAGFRQNCIRDLCAAGRHQPTLCRAFTAYALACQEAGIALGTWREQTRCPLFCPPDSDYEPCGDPCVPTCADPYPGSCAGRCVERCRCRPGLLLNRGRCVPPAQCGCQHKGQALPPGAQFWEDAACSRRCRCHPDTRTVECEPGACQPGQACGVRGGLRGCYPIRWATCSSPGDPHYISFDGRAFAFHNPCGTYLLAGSGLPLEDFQILLDSNRTSGDASSRTVRVRVYGTEVAISHEHPGRILLNGSPTHLPYLPNDLPLTVHRVGFLAELRTGFDLIVTFDWSNQVRVSVPVAYEGALRGLCGDLDGNPGNDLIPRGEPRDPASKPDDPVAFAGSWREPGPDGQTCAEPVVRPAACPNPEAAERAQRQSPVACGLLVDPKGPFRDCHAMHDPDPAFRRCTYLSCSEPRDPDRVCQELAHYTSVCQLAGRRVDPWRSGSFCGMLCPVHSHYDVCGSGCEDTCGSPWAPTPCARQCREGCVCDSGHLLSGDQCVEPKQCGCLHDGVYYEAGSEFYPGPQCTPRCRCGAGGMVVCEPSSCRRGERCVVQGGVPECRPHGSISCFVRGRGHLVTFDGRAVDIPEHRAYVLAQAPGPQPFTVRLGHGRRGQREGPATRWVELEMAGSVLVLEEKRSGIDGWTLPLPLSLAEGSLRAFPRGPATVVQEASGLELAYDLAWQLVLTVTGDYRGLVRGLCGRGHEPHRPDLPSGTPTPDSGTLPEAWEVDEGGTKPPTTEVLPVEPPACSREDEETLRGRDHCGLLADPGGPFAACHGHLSPDDHVRACSRDLCRLPQAERLLCLAAQGYVSACQAAGVTMSPWRTETFCPPTVLPDGHYALCTETGLQLCATREGWEPGKETCFEGVRCEEGWWLSQGRCVPPDQCGCFHDGRYFLPDEKVLLPGCEQMCVCTPGRGVRCSAHSCEPGTGCQVSDGVVQCVQRDPCQGIQCEVEEVCVAGTCQKEDMATCMAWGDHQFSTFDGNTYSFQGRCTYVLASLRLPEAGSGQGASPPSARLTPFTILFRNGQRSNGALSAEWQTDVQLLNHTVSLQREGRTSVMLDGILTKLPVSLASGAIRLSLSGRNIILKTNVGLSVLYRGWILMVRLGLRYRGRTQGLCGDFNGDSSDDVILPDGRSHPGIEAWVREWKVADDDSCSDECEPHCSSCSPQEKQLYGSPGFCGILSTGVPGPFAGCHAAVPPAQYVENCLYYVCSNWGARQILCQALSRYAAECQRTGATLQEWREMAGCRLSCPAHSHYELCASSCPASCSSLRPAETCPLPCAERCQCDDGFVASGDDCVSLDTCGCSHHGRYYQLGQEWATSGCRERCQCPEGGGSQARCQPWGCGPRERCAVRDGVVGCHALSMVLCSLAGGQLTTFDGRQAGLTGGCSLLLARHSGPSGGRLQPFAVTVGGEADDWILGLEVGNRNLKVERGALDRLQVDGETVFLPVSDPAGYLAYRSGQDLVLLTAFDLHLAVSEGSGLLHVEVPASYRGALEGLCGDGDGDAANDLEPGAGDEAGPWRLKEGACEPSSAQALSDEEQERRREGPCSVVADREGPLAGCHATLDPDPFLRACIEARPGRGAPGKGEPELVCDAIAAYVAACQGAGAELQEWRSLAQCDVTCPPNSHYELRGDGCPVTCRDLAPPAGCVSSPREGCACDTGHVLSGAACVLPADCGCVLDGRYHPPDGGPFYSGPDCTKRCSCAPGGSLACEPWACEAKEECQLQQGAWTCLPVGLDGRCTIASAAHVVSFDGRSFSAWGACGYTLARTCSPGPEPFSIVLLKDKLGDPGSLVITVAGVSLTLHRKTPWLVEVDGEMVILPLELKEAGVLVNQVGATTMLKWEGGGKLTDADGFILLRLSGAYRGRVCGLCGNFNEDPGDDLLLPDGQQANDPKPFTEAWARPEAGQACRSHCGERCGSCSGDAYEGPRACGLLELPDGPFAACHAHVAPAQFAQRCVEELCSTAGHPSSLCRGLHAYAVVCRGVSAPLGPWRNSTFCRERAPRPSAPAWEGRATASLGRCFEGCECPAGTLAEAGHCVPSTACGCIHQGRYLQIVNSDCTERCRCAEDSNLQCEPHSCEPEVLCGLRAGVRGCLAPEASCTVGPLGRQLTTFTGAQVALSSGTFQLAARCYGNATPWFRVVSEVKHCEMDPNPSLTVYVFVPEGLVVMQHGRGIWVRPSPTPPNGCPLPSVPSLLDPGVLAPPPTLRAPSLLPSFWDLDGGSGSYDGKVKGRTGLGWEDEFFFGHVRVEVSAERPSRDDLKAAGKRRLQRRRAIKRWR
uniref:VWFD domain-containing protein n=1 Tax=Ornithorhynchus anatinus TaxID=9258 RepID=A0A6I8PGX6_ORNAN